MHRIAFYLFYDENGVVDDYIPYKLNKLNKHVQKIIVICNTPLTKNSQLKLENLGVDLLFRENMGFDVWGYKDGLESIGFNKLTKNYDELILLNYTFFGPIFSFRELFNDMESRQCDFWGISEHAEVIPNPFTGYGSLHRHIQSHFIAVRNKMFSSLEFQQYWEEMPEIKSYTDSILIHESRFTYHFNNLGYSYECYLPLEDYKTEYPLFNEIDKTLENRSPILKRRPFFHEPLWLDKNAISLNKVRNIIKQNSDYDFNLIKSNLLRTVKPRTLYANQEMLKIFPINNVINKNKLRYLNNKKIAVIIHLHYTDMWHELKLYLDRIPINFDLYISTSSYNNKKILKEFITTDYPFLKKSIRVVEQNRGRDMSSLFITFRDICIDNHYDFICRLHSKKSPQNKENIALHFKEHLLDNLLASSSYIIDLLYFMKKENAGIVIPPVVHIGYPTLGHAWFTNKLPAQYWANKLNISTPFDDNTPIAAYGTMFWFKPEALRKIFMYEFKWTDFNEEPDHNDGGLAHVLERLIAYASADAGYETFCAMNTESAEKNYVHLETKMISIMSQLYNGDVFEQYQNLISNKNISLHGSFRVFIFLLKERIKHRHPLLGHFLAYPYRPALKIYKILYKWSVLK